ncbi:cbb3-type cytochrome oxidase maturation protein [Ancylomarina subtilis]|uniref:Cbb3-type cytochrome oxidase maturation protein n=1 Tax=Ancylomarina subtilis TaxID=1639035 RepID=A0A4Q7VLW1_9BACT|nr:cbb3-type cytochrome oxidase assembly protein CcoS [Ancylomarina subtilis]RZT97117.1 cbb3-type cytochrome oxidase maturation protein [Ancylomarina subtilis]
MSVIFVLIAVSMVVAGGFLIGFLWAVKKGQYDDHYSPSVRILFDDEELKDQEKIKTKNTEETETESKSSED